MEHYAHSVVSYVFSNVIALVIGAYLESRLGWIERLVGYAKNKIDRHV